MTFVFSINAFYKKNILKNFVILTENHLCRSLFQHGCFPVNIARFLRTPILENIWERMVVDWEGEGCH